MVFMKSDKQIYDNFLISFHDLGLILRRSKKKILFATLLTACLFLWFAIDSPILYQVESTFQEKSTSSTADVSNSLLVMMTNLGQNSTDNEATVVMKSRKLMEPLVQSLGMQAIISHQGRGLEDSPFSRIFNNLKVEIFSFRPALYPILSDFSFPLKASNVIYRNEVPLALTLKFTSDDTYDVIGNNDVIGKGTIDQPFATQQYQFTIHHKQPNAQVYAKEFSLVLLPMCTSLKCIAARLKIEADKGDKTLLKLEFRHRDRHLAANFLNTLMNQYEKYLQKSLDDQSNIQLAYLERRQIETAEQLSNLMQEHAKTLSADFSNVGFADSQVEMEFLTLRQQRYQEQLMANKLEITRLQNIKTDRCVYYDQHASYGDPVNINKILTEIRELKQQRNSLELALRQDPLPTNLINIHVLFAKQIDELSTIQQQSADIKSILASLEENKAIDPTMSIFNESSLLINPWIEKLNDKKLALEKSHPSEREQLKKEWQDQKNNFYSYLTNLQRIFTVHEKVIQERLTHHQSPQMEFQGIDLATAREIYINYSKLVNNIESQIRQNIFVIKQLEDPSFEISSLSKTMDDAVSQDTVIKASELIKQLQDESNRSSKEQDRIKTDLILQRQFLTQHLLQTTQLSELSQKLYREKIRSLQNVTLELINQQISVLDKNLIDYIADRLENLKQERILFEEHMVEIHQQMATLPQKWATEKLIERELESSQFVVEEITKLVEKKNISHNLQVVQSAPLDAAIAPINPVQPRLLSSFMIGAILGALMGLSFVVVKALISGVPVTAEGLVLANQYVAGSISAAYPSKTLLDQDLSTLRRLYRYFRSGQDAPKQSQGQTMVLIEGNSADYSHDLALLMSKEGLKVLRIFLDFNSTNNSDELPGLLQYLEGKADYPKITSEAEGDRIVGGGISRFSNELLRSERFQTLLKKLQEKYDYVIAVTHALPASPEAENLSILFSAVAVTVMDEKRQDIEAFIVVDRNSEKKVAFVFGKKEERT